MGLIPVHTFHYLSEPGQDEIWGTQAEMSRGGLFGLAMKKAASH